MRNGVVLGVVTGIATAMFAIWLSTSPTEAHGQARRDAVTGKRDTHVLTVPASNGRQYVLIVDTTARVLMTYEISPEKGHLSLCSVRRYEWDSQMNDFNGSEPKPSDVRAIVEQR